MQNREAIYNSVYEATYGKVYNRGYDDGIATATAVAPYSDPTARLRLTSEAPTFFEDRGLATTELRYYLNALVRSRPCTEMDSCSGLWEFRGSSDYHTVPLVTTFSGFNDMTFIIVSAEVQRIRGVEDVYTPRFVIYGRTPLGSFRMDEDSAWERTAFGPEWKRIDHHSEFVQGVRHQALELLVMKTST